MLTPRPIISRIAGRPGLVAGILTITLGRLQRSCSSWAMAIVRLVDLATAGDTSMETKPSAPRVRSNSGRKTSAAAWMSSTIRSQSMSSGRRPWRTRRTIASS